jgi:hypothetical protein
VHVLGLSDVLRRICSSTARRSAALESSTTPLSSLDPASSSGSALSLCIAGFTPKEMFDELVIPW